MRAASLGLNRSTTGSIVNTLFAESLVVERPLERDSEPVAYRPSRHRPRVQFWRRRFHRAEIEVDRLTVVAIDLTGRLIRLLGCVRRSRVAGGEERREDRQDGRSAARSASDPSRVLGLWVAVSALVEAGIERWSAPELARRSDRKPDRRAPWFTSSGVDRKRCQRFRYRPTATSRPRSASAVQRRLRPHTTPMVYVCHNRTIWSRAAKAQRERAGRASHAQGVNDNAWSFLRAAP